LQDLLSGLGSARLRFGKFLRNWRRRNGWSVTTPMEWAKACPELIPWEYRISGGQWGNLENAKVMQPQPSTFLQLGVLNACLSQPERGVIEDLTLRERVQQAQAICHADGTPWGPEDWFACYIGSLQGPDDLWPSQHSIDAEEETRRLQSLFRSTLQASGLGPASAAIQVLRRAGDLPMDQIVAIENALFEGTPLPPELVERTRDAVASWVAEAEHMTPHAAGRGSIRGLKQRSRANSRGR